MLLGCTEKESELKRATKLFDENEVEQSMEIVDNLLSVDSNNVQALRLKCRSMYYLGMATESLPFAFRLCSLTNDQDSDSEILEMLKWETMRENRLDRNSPFFNIVYAKSPHYIVAMEAAKEYDLQQKADTSLIWYQTACQISENCECLKGISSAFQRLNMGDSAMIYQNRIEELKCLP